jgi:hypothetical protein
VSRPSGYFMICEKRVMREHHVDGEAIRLGRSHTMAKIFQALQHLLP